MDSLATILGAYKLTKAEARLPPSKPDYCQNSWNLFSQSDMQDASAKGKEIWKIKGGTSNTGKVGDQNATMGRPKAAAWCPPAEGCIEINVDATYCDNFGYAAAGIVARNVGGEVLFAANQVLNNCFDPENAEACPLKFAVQQALNNCSLPVVFESDSALVISKINSNTAPACISYNIYRDIHHLISGLSSCKFKKISRGCNRTAHELAALAQHGRTSNFWMGSVPPVIAELVCKDNVTVDIDA